MNESKNKLISFEEIIQLSNLLEKHNMFKSMDELDAYVHAIGDISESTIKIYSIIQEVLKTDDKALIKDKLWDITEEFRHIDYHIKDADLAKS